MTIIDLQYWVKAELKTNPGTYFAIRYDYENGVCFVTDLQTRKETKMLKKHIKDFRLISIISERKAKEANWSFLDKAYLSTGWVI